MVVDKDSNLDYVDGRPTMDAWLNVTDEGTLTLSFEEPLKKFNEGMFDSKLMKVFLSGDGEEKDYTVEWKVRKATDSLITIDLIFDNPSKVGLFENTDYINITFMTNNTLVSLGNKVIGY